MSTSFPSTSRAIGQSSTAARLVLVSAMLIACGWGVWFVRARVLVYAASEHARIEVERATHPVDAQVTGRVVAVRLALEAPVSVGDVLVELDAVAERLQLAQARAKLGGLATELDATRRQVAAEDHALTAFRQQLGAALGEAESRLREGEILTRAARAEAERNRRMVAENIVSKAELDRVQAEADRRAAAEVGLRAALDRVRRESTTGEADRQARVATLGREVARLDAERSAVTASVLSLEYEIERRTIRAPASGRVGELGTARVGSVLAQGAHVATIVAGGDLRVVASFEPASSLGRVHAGQRARLRLDGFPWTEYGAVDATVTEVATELRDGRVRVELGVSPRRTSRIPLQHGMPGVVEITVEEVSPAALVLRAAGRLGAVPRAAAAKGP
jgi:multidrug resistance efflux pump